jgi:hypothetical protein
LSISFSNSGILGPKLFVEAVLEEETEKRGGVFTENEKLFCRSFRRKERWSIFKK